MLLRSSSTPVLGSLLPSFSDSPNRDFDSNNNKHQLSSDHSFLKKISFSHGGHSSFSSFSCNSPPISHSVVGLSDFDRELNSPNRRGLRRAQSDGNLEGLNTASCNRSNSSMLQTIPSFSTNNSGDGCEDEDEDEEEEEEFYERDGLMKRSVTIGDSIVAIVGGEFSFEKNNVSLIEEGSMNAFRNSGLEEEREFASPQLYLARGLGIDISGFGGGGGGGGDGNFVLTDSGGGGQNGSDSEEYYKRMVEENPCNPLFLRNYAQFLYQSKRDLWGADEYYSRAILADPGDGEILSQYAKLVWELHHDHERASSYFERAVQAAPKDSHVLAAYASFLWETEDDNEEDRLHQDLVGVQFSHDGAMAYANA